jgi:hypothetical protein
LDELHYERPNGTFRIVDNSYVVTGYPSDFENPIGARNTDYNRHGYGDVPTSFPVGIANEALIKAKLKVKDQDFNAAQAFGERRETAQTVSAILGTITKSALQMKRGQWKQGLKTLGSAANPKNSKEAVLAWKYGVKPLASDISGACEALDKAESGPSNVVTIKAKVTKNWKIEASTEPSDLPGGPREWRRMFGLVSAGSFVRFDLRPENRALITASSLGLLNPVALAWELLPVSFVADWALPLGDYFSSLDALVGWEVAGYSQSNFFREDLSWIGIGGYSPFSGATFENTMKSYLRTYMLDRTGDTSIPMSMLPDIRDPFNSKSRVLSAVALLGIALKSWERAAR